MTQVQPIVPQLNWENRSAAYKEGYAARLKGVPISSNPFKDQAGVILYGVGWEQADKDCRSTEAQPA